MRNKCYHAICLSSDIKNKQSQLNYFPWLNPALTYCNKPVRLLPVAKLRLQVHLTGWSQSVEVEVGN